jgi:hypothetical protein
MNAMILFKNAGRISFETCVALTKAFGIRLFKKDLLTELPLVGPPSSDAYTMVFLIDSIVNVALFWKPGKCFYRSYCRAYVLRKRGLPLLFNFGMQIKGNTKVKVHCWLTLDGKPFMEKNNSPAIFPVNMGSHKGQISYWMGFERDLRAVKK